MVFQIGNIPWNKGKRGFQKGAIPWNKGIPCPDEVREKIKNTSMERIRDSSKPWHNKEILYKEYIENKRSFHELAKEWNVSSSKTIRRWAQKFNIPIRNKSEAGKIRNYKNPIGKDSHSWRGGTVDFDGYVGVYQGFINNKTTYKFEHVIKAEKALGRKLKKDEIVHHINGDRSDNRNENLLICDRKYHGWLEWRMADLYKKEHFGGQK